MTHQGGCIFCQIIAGKIPSYKVYEDSLFFGFLDINPRSKGHVLLIPKAHHRWTYDVPEFEQYWGAALKITHAIQKVLQPKWIKYYTFGEIAHAHIHIQPRYDEMKSTDETPIMTPVEKVGAEEMVQIAKKLFAETSQNNSK